MGNTSIAQMAERISDLMVDRLGLRGRTLSDQLKRAGRSLPRRIRKEAALLARAAEEAGHPALARRIDEARVARAYDACLHHLKLLGAGQRWRNRLMDFAASLALILLVTLAVVATFLALGPMR